MACQISCFEGQRWCPYWVLVTLCSNPSFLRILLSSIIPENFGHRTFWMCFITSGAALLSATTTKAALLDEYKLHFWNNHDKGLWCSVAIKMITKRALYLSVCFGFTGKALGTRLRRTGFRWIWPLKGRQSKLFSSAFTRHCQRFNIFWVSSWSMENMTITLLLDRFSIWN